MFRGYGQVNDGQHRTQNPVGRRDKDRDDVLDYEL